MELLRIGPLEAKLQILLAHGAGASMRSPFMEAMAQLLAQRDLGTIRFDFAYMTARVSEGKRRPPPRAECLKEEFLAAIGQIKLGDGQKLIIGGKSMGGRVASMIADEAFATQRIQGLVCLGYPFHPVGKPQQLRTAHLETLRCPTLVVQGERDPFGNRDDVANYKLSPAIKVRWVDDGDHDLGPRGNSGFTRKGNLIGAADAIAAFASEL